MNPLETFEVLEGGNATIQDAGRFGWQRFGVPSSGAMDEHAFRWANTLLDNPPDAPCIEILGRFQARVLADSFIAFTGADFRAKLNGHPLSAWHTVEVRRDDTITLSSSRTGLWCYLAVAGGFDAPLMLGSASVYQRGGLGRALQRGDVLNRKPSTMNWSRAVAGRFVASEEIPDYTQPLIARVVLGPQEDLFAKEEREKFFSSEYKLTSQFDRVGYRLEGAAIHATTHDIFSEGITYGAIQIPENGQPIVMMKDRPTVGGYPKIGTLLPEDTARLAQCRTGQTVRFQIAD